MKAIVEQDTYFESPRDYNPLGTMVCFHSRYNIGDNTDLTQDMFGSWSNLKEYLEDGEDAICILPIYMYDHSGITVSTSPFSCPFDSGQIGFIYATQEDMESHGVTEESIKEQLHNEIEIYNQYLTGEIWSYTILDDSGAVVDSCGGFYNKKVAEIEANEALERALIRKAQVTSMTI